MSGLAASPLQVVAFPQVSRQGQIPLMMEFPVNGDLAPFLVSASSKNREVLWVNRAQKGKVRAASREVPDIHTFFLSVADAVILEGRASGWDNIHPLSKEGILLAKAHVEAYELGPLEMLANPKINWSKVESTWEVEDGEIVLHLLDMPVQPAPWLPTDTIMIVPVDRELVGFVLLLEGRLISLVHNAARGMGFATSRQPAPPAPFHPTKRL